MYTDDSIIRRFPYGKSSREFPNAIYRDRKIDGKLNFLIQKHIQEIMPMRGSLLVHPPTKLDQGVTDFYVDANFALGTIDWQLEWDQGVTEYYTYTNFAVRPFVWQLELDQDVNEL